MDQQGHVVETVAVKVLDKDRPRFDSTASSREGFLFKDRESQSGLKTPRGSGENLQLTPRPVDGRQIDTAIAIQVTGGNGSDA